ncbi:sulfotransferase family protein [Sedimenticola sp.]|uniref:sulfotransferase family protein n=1 Tax=Sedimenticola sp. TaxID=1940285 RepID=UPI003D14FA51
MLKYYLRSLVVSWKIYGFGRVFFAFLFGEAFLRIFTSATLFLDNIFFRHYRAVQVKRPVFIFGHPRSGTTFLHHLLTSTDETAAFKMWHILLPALSARFLMKPMIDARIRKGRSELIPASTGHRIDLDQIEEEEMLFLQNYDTQFIAIGMLGLDNREYPELHFQDGQPASKRMKSMRFLNGCFQRHILFTGCEQLIAQTHFSTMRLKTMLEYYPDAKFIYVVRNPHHVVPSFLSLLHKSLDFRWGLKQIPNDVLERYYRRRYQAMIDLYRYFYALQKNGEIPPDRVMIQPYNELLTDLEGAFEKISAFTKIEFSRRLRTEVIKMAARQKSFQRKHEVMEPERFGITHEMIARDFAFVFEEYGIDPNY